MESSERGRTAVEAACLQRFGTLLSAGTSVLRSDNGLIFQSRQFREACRGYRLRQKFITPYAPEQNGIIERFFHGLKSFGTGYSGTTTRGHIKCLECFLVE